MSPKQKNKLKILAEWMKSLAYSMMTFSLRTEDSVYSKSQSGQVQLRVGGVTVAQSSWRSLAPRERSSAQRIGETQLRGGRVQFRGGAAKLQGNGVQLNVGKVQLRQTGRSLAQLGLFLTSIMKSLALNRLSLDEFQLICLNYLETLFFCIQELALNKPKERKVVFNFFL